VLFKRLDGASSAHDGNVHCVWLVGIFLSTANVDVMLLCQPVHIGCRRLQPSALWLCLQQRLWALWMLVCVGRILGALVSSWVFELCCCVTCMTQGNPYGLVRPLLESGCCPDQMLWNCLRFKPLTSLCAPQHGIESLFHSWCAVDCGCPRFDV